MQVVKLIGEASSVMFFLQVLQKNSSWIGNGAIIISPSIIIEILSSHSIYFRKKIYMQITLYSLPSSFDRYWTHTVNCSSCNAAYKSLNILEVVLQIAPVALLGLLAAMKQNAMSTLTRNIIVLMAVLCFAAARWLTHFIHKNFHYHDYDHAFV